jgi:predicted RNase H-like HicB family nuclease
MTRKYSLVIEGEPGSYSAHVPELPMIVITGETLDELNERAVGAIKFYFEEIGEYRSPTAMVREIEVELPA